MQVSPDWLLLSRFESNGQSPLNSLKSRYMREIPRRTASGGRAIPSPSEVTRFLGALSGGMQALQKMSILESILRVSITGTTPREDGRGGFGVWDTQWNRIFGFRPQAATSGELPVSGMRIARYALRQELVDAVCENATIRWATTCTSVEQVEDGKIRVHLNDGRVDECDILIAADGQAAK